MFALNRSSISKRLVGYWKLCMTIRSSVASVSSSTVVYNGTTRLPRGVRVMRTCTLGLLQVLTASKSVANSESLNFNFEWHIQQSNEFHHVKKQFTDRLSYTTESIHFCIRCGIIECFRNL